MRARIDPWTRFRLETHGLLFYVGSRDDFFYCDWDTSQDLMAFLKCDWEVVPSESEELAAALAQLGVLEVDKPLPVRSFSGPGLLGRFPDRVAVRSPMVVNCFVTGHCPLACRYCHAEDLMRSSRGLSEPVEWLESAIETATRIPSLVSVLTGGDPLAAPDRLARAVERLAGEKAVVIDTSGFSPASVDRLLSLFERERVHVRVSLDSLLPSQNDRLRPMAGRSRSGALEAALESIKLLLAAGIPTSVQTVVTKHNASMREIRATRDALVRLEVQNWVLHLFTPAGVGATREALLPPKSRESAKKAIREVMQQTIAESVPIDMRVTDATPRPNSILLIGQDGTLYTEGSAGQGKREVYSPRLSQSNYVLQDLFSVVDAFGHTERYLNLPQFFFDESQPPARLVLPARASQARERILAGSDETKETEIKLRLLSDEEVLATVNQLRADEGELRHAEVLRDAYYDDWAGTLRQRDFVLRLRSFGNRTEAAIKGPRVISLGGIVERLEVEIPTWSFVEAEREVVSRWPVRTWYLEKYQIRLGFERGTATVDLIPHLGWFLELEGPISWIDATQQKLGLHSDRVVRDNYAELVRKEYDRKAVAHPLSEDERERGAQVASACGSMTARPPEPI